MDRHAQHEIRAYSHLIGHEIVAKWCPITWEAFLDYRLRSMVLSRLDVQILRALLTDAPSEATAAAGRLGLLSFEGDLPKPNRERAELEAKLKQLGLEVPWRTVG
jgi:thymidylate synthase (FAD)